MKKISSTKDKSLFRKYSLSGLGRRGGDEPRPIRLKNMYVNYDGGGCLESMVGYRRIGEHLGVPHSIFSLKTDLGDFIYIHSSDFIYRFLKNERDLADKTRLIAKVQNQKSIAVSRGSAAFIYDGDKVYGFDKEGVPYSVFGSEKVGKVEAMEIYDGRLFCAVGSDLIYSDLISEGKITLPCENRIYSPSLGAHISSLLSSDGRLWIFKSFDDGEGGIICRKRGERCADKPTYPISKVFSGIYAYGNAVACDGEVFFLSRSSLYSIDTAKDDKLSLMTPLVSEFLDGELKNAKIGMWKGYIAIMSGEKICLADRRRSSFGELERFPILGIGGYKNTRRVYRYSTERREGFSLSKTPDAKVSGEVYSMTDEGGEIIYFEDGEEKYLIYATDEMEGGEFFPAICYFIEDDLIWFGSGEGGIYLFNSDKTGVCPDHLKNGVTGECYPDKIHPFYYSFAGHKPEYYIEFSSDDGGFCHFNKLTYPASLSVGHRAMIMGGFRIRVMCDGRLALDTRVDSSLFSFADTDLSNIGGEGVMLTNFTEISAPYRTKKIEILSDEYSSPICLDFVCYRYKLIPRSGQI